ncbi:MAG TPA: LamG-like jellyroll fold domain-containing protein [Pelobium sp.]|nr:LamG-like jellyroll fold domain-containing protein [Pelobium sp.]
MNKTLQNFLVVAFFALSLPNKGLAQNNALHFDGDAVITGLSGISPASFTIEFWMKSTYSGANRYQGIYWQNSGNGRGIYMDNYEADYAHSQTLSIFPNASDYTAFQSWSASTPDGDIPSAQQNIWRHYAITYDGSNIKFYFDGTLIRTVAYSGALLPTTNVQIGGGAYPITDYSLDELRIWDFAKTQSQIQDQKDVEVLSNSTGLVRYYDFNQGVSGGNNAGVATLIERVGGNTNGTLSNFTLSGSTSNWINGAPVNNVLSVKLAQFSVNSLGQGALLKWKTNSEKDNAKFEIYRSGNDNSFVKIGEVFGSGTSAIAKNYSFNDKHPLKGDNYYKLIQIDGNGKTNELGVKLLSTDLISSAITFYPNPVKNQLIFEVPQMGKVLFVYNALGKLMLQKTISQERNVIDVNTLEPGVYMYSYGQQKGKFVKE